MATNSLPYLNGYGTISKALEKIRSASTPDRFTQDFLSTKLGLKSSSARPLIPFFKRIGFLAPDGSPTDLYTAFRNTTTSGAAVAEGMRVGYAPIFELNEYAHEVNDDELRGLVVQATGADAESQTVKSTVASFKALKEFASFGSTIDSDDEIAESHARTPTTAPSGINLGYTINLQLPATTDSAVFNAIFKSLREHLIDV